MVANPNQPPNIAAQQASELSGLPGAPGLTPSTSPAATSTANTIGQDVLNTIYTNFPNLAWLLNVPSVAPLLIQAAQTGMGADQFNAAFESTAWYQQNSQSVRNWIAEVETDPAKAQADLQAQESSINATMAGLGLRPTPQQIQSFAQQSLAMGWTDQQIKDNIAAGIHAGDNGTFTFTYGGATTTSGTSGTLEANISSIQASAAKYLVPVSPTTVDSFAIALSQGTMDPTGVDAYFQTQAESMYPSIAGAIKAGITPADYVTPYKEVAAQLLGVAPASIDMTKPQYARALSAPGPGGVPTAMSLYDWQQLLM